MCPIKIVNLPHKNQITHNRAEINQKSPFEKVYTDYYMLAYKYIFKKIGNSHLAEDLTGDVFYKAFKNYESYDPEKASVKTWLFRIIENHLKNYYRDKKVTSNIDDNINEPALMRDDIMTEATTLQECRDVLAEVLGTLKEKNRKIIVLKYFYNKSAEDIAAELGMTAGNVRITMMRTLKKMSDYFAQKGYNLEDYIG